MTRVAIWLVSSCAAIAASCTDVSAYSTAPGECYQGVITSADYLRAPAFPEGTQMMLTLDANALGQGESGTFVSTSNGMFGHAPVLQVQQITFDKLSGFTFPGGRVRNYLAFAQPLVGSTSTIIISLMEDETIEVRILRPDGYLSDKKNNSLFGVWRLVRNEHCQAVDEFQKEQAPEK